MCETASSRTGSDNGQKKASLSTSGYPNVKTLNVSSLILERISCAERQMVDLRWLKAEISCKQITYLIVTNIRYKTTRILRLKALLGTNNQEIFLWLISLLRMATPFSMESSSFLPFASSIRSIAALQSRE